MHSGEDQPSVDEASNSHLQPVWDQLSRELNKSVADISRVFNEEVLNLDEGEMRGRTAAIKDQTGMLTSMRGVVKHELTEFRLKTKDNSQKVNLNRQLPYLVATVAEILDEVDDGTVLDGVDSGIRNEYADTKTAIIKTTTRQSVFLPTIGLVHSNDLEPNQLVGVNKDSYLILEKLPLEYDSRVTAMEVEEKPTADYSEIGGCDKQIQELIEAIVLPMTHADRFEKLGIKPPKGCLLYGPPGTGKTLLARAIAAQTEACFLKLAGPELVQMFIGDGAKIVRDAFDMARAKAPAIIFIDEIDAVGAKRTDNEENGDREVQRTMLELLNQLDGFNASDGVKVIAATNRPDTLDPALLRSGRLDRKVELPHPNEEGRIRILEIHSRSMHVRKDDVSFKELAKATNNFNGAQLKAVCVEAGMVTLRRGGTELFHEDFVEGIMTVESKKQKALDYFS